MSSTVLSKILVPVDLSSCSRAALEFACKLALPFSTQLEVLFVRVRDGIMRTDAPNAAGGDETEAARVELHRFVRSVAETGSVAISERVVSGDASEEILRAAAEGRFDAIVLGTHGRTGRARSLAGSVAESTVRRAACPVITVREPN